MGDLEIALRHVQDIGDDDHWFCPRKGLEQTRFYPEDRSAAGISSTETDAEKAEIEARLKDTAKHKTDILDVLQVFGFGAEAQQHKQWIEDKLAEQLGRCEICVREYHRLRAELKQMLENAEVGEDAVTEFLSRVDNMNLRRISKGLERVKTTLLALPEQKRTPRALDRAGVYSIFETINCIPLLTNDDLLQQHFDEPFALISTKRPLKLSNYPPAITYFLFGNSEKRCKWAKFAWSSVTRNITATEFEWSVRQPLFEAMLRVQLTSLDEPFLPQFWSGVRHIVAKLDKDLISRSLRSMDLDICKLAFDLLQVDSDGFIDLLGSMKHILTVSPQDFWDAMGTTPAMGWIEQFFNSKALKRFLSKIADDDASDQLVKEIFSWMVPFWNSMKPTAQSSTCGPVVKQLLVTLPQQQEYSSTVTLTCQRIALELLKNTLLNIYSSFQTGGRPMASPALDTVEENLHFISTAAKAGSKLRELCAIILKKAIGLDCRGMVVDRNDISQEMPTQPGMCTFRSKIWQSADVALGIGNVALARQLTVALEDLVGLEKYVSRPPKSVTQEQQQFNETLDALNGYICDFLARIGEYNATDAKSLFKDGGFVDAIFALMFSSSASVRQASLEIIKTATENTIRKEALASIVQLAYTETLNGLSHSLTILARDKAYVPAASAVRVCNDIFEALCDSQNGVLRSRDLTRSEALSTQKFWSSTWNELIEIFRSTQAWNGMGHDRAEMSQFCQQTMIFAGYVFHQFGVFSGKLREALGSEPSKPDANIGKGLLALPQRGTREIIGWLRLKDQDLLSSASSLVTDLLIRMKEFETTVDQRTLEGLEAVVTSRTRTNLTMQQKAELQRAMGIHQGIEHVEDPEEKNVRPARLGEGVKRSDEIMKNFIQSSTLTAEKVRKEQHSSEAVQQRPKPLVAPKESGYMSVTEIRRRREEEAARLKREKEAALADYRKPSNIPQGVLGKDHSLPKGEGMMVSSSESESSDSDEELFGPKEKSLDPKMKAYYENRARSMKQKPQGPVKKQRLQRTMKDMRARLAPDLSKLHKNLLAWEYFHEGPFPPGSSAEEYQTVLGEFRSPVDYQKTFFPLLVLEAWNGFLKAKEENTFKPYDIKVASRASVDAFIEMSSVVPVAEGRDLSEGDIILLSKSNSPTTSENAPHCLSRIYRIHRNKGMLEVSYRAMPGSSIIADLAPGAVVYGLKIMSIIPLEREFGALEGLQYYDLCDEITRAKPSPLLNYTDHHLQPLMRTYNVNEAQAKAVKSAVDNDAFTLIQGPPGSGKTKTIVAIVGALIGQSLSQTTGGIQIPGGQSAPASMAKKMLVCAPSNAAVDELVMRFKEGIITVAGEHKKINVLRVGRSDAINANVQDVTLDELVSKRLGNKNDGASASEEVRKIMTNHKEISERLRDAQAKMDTTDSPDTRKEVADLRRSKAMLSEQIDSAKDKEKQQQGQASANERRVRQAVVDESHVICATLSGSGHEMFQNLNVEFETVVIDEAAQCVELSALIPLKYGCAKCVLVGDPQQLPPTVFSKEAARFKYEQSLFVRMQENHSRDIHLLDTQYRMHPEISTFPSQAFYDGRLKDGPNMAKLRKRPWHVADVLGPYRFFDVQGQHEAAVRGHSLINKAEINVALALYRRLTREFVSMNFKNKIGIITPYKSQLRELKTRFGQAFGQQILEDIEFNTTDAFQGRESEIIIFSCVRASASGGIGFLQDIRRMNVGLTRAKASLWVLGNSQSLVKGEYWKKLVEHSKTSGRYTDGNVEAIFNRPLQRSGKVEEYDDEAMMDASDGTTPEGDLNGVAIDQKKEAPTDKLIKQEPDHDRLHVKRKLSDESSEQPLKRGSITPVPSHEASRPSSSSSTNNGLKTEASNPTAPKAAAPCIRVKAKPLPGGFGFGGKKASNAISPVENPPVVKKEPPETVTPVTTSAEASEGDSPAPTDVPTKKPAPSRPSSTGGPPVWRKKKGPADPFIRRKPGTRP